MEDMLRTEPGGMGEDDKGDVAFCGGLETVMGG
jgi:hypothetical protein